MATKMTKKAVPFDKIVRVKNLRDHDTRIEDFAHLIESMKDHGLEEPLKIDVVNGVYQLTQGYLRHSTISWLRVNEPEIFDHFFSKGVPAEVYEGATPQEIALRHVDHGLKKGLTSETEVQRAANMLFDVGIGMNKASLHLSGLLDQMWPVKGEAVAELKKLQEAGDQIGWQQRYVGYRHGKMQELMNVWKLPDIVMMSLDYLATGELPPGHKPEDFPAKLTINNGRALWKEFEKDLKIEENGVPLFNKKKPGPSFKAAWNKLVKDSRAPKKKTDPDKAPMTPKEINENLLPNIHSTAMKVAFRKAAGPLREVNIEEYDRDAYRIELIKTHDASFYQQVCERAAEIEKSLADAEKAADAAASTDAAASN